jgi:hypothetical protein
MVDDGEVRNYRDEQWHDWKLAADNIDITDR